MSDDALSRKLRRGECVVGYMTKHPGASIVEALGMRGWDFVVIDAEHGPIDPLECEQMTRAAEVGGCAAVVRVPARDKSTIMRYLDVGPQGLHVPMIETRADAETVGRYAKYWPDGERGLASVRAASYGAGGGLAAYTARANAELLVVAQIETGAAVEQIDEIVSTPAIDVVFIGSTDLANSLGLLGQPDHPRLLAALERISTAVRNSSKTLGIMVANEDDARIWIDRGARYICFLFENLLVRGGAGLVDIPRQVDGGNRSVGGLESRGEISPEVRSA